MSPALEGEIVDAAVGPTATAIVKAMPVAITDALVLQRDPTEVLAEATRAAKALVAVMAQKPDKVMMNGQQYIENEDWLTIGHFYGVTAQIESDQFVAFGDVTGWEATAILVARDGRILGRATAMCLNDEEKWSTRAKKEWAYCLGPEEDCGKHQHSVEDPGPGKLIWVPNPNKPGKNLPKKTRMVVGEEKVPLFQLRSMAQTRASSRVHASVLRFVPVLAGFKATPAEELPDAERVSNHAPQQAVTPSSPTAGAPTGNTSVPNVGDSGAPNDTTTRRIAPAGFFYIDGYTFRNGWHEFRLLQYDNQGGSIKLSTKKNIGYQVEQAAAAGLPIKVTTAKKGNSPGEAYLDSVTVWQPDADLLSTAELDAEIAAADRARKAGEVL